MSDHSRYKSPSGAQLVLRRRTGDPLDLDERLFLMVDGRGMFIPTADLLTMIDRADPDAMRAYLRETVEHAYLENMGVPATEPAPAAADHFDYLEPVKVTPERLDSIPEADSPEDVDERPDHADPTDESAQIARSWALDKAADALGRLSAVGSPAGALPLLDVAGWIIDGTINLPEQILDTTAAGEVIS